ncbi:MAG: PEGA domain-containing protein [Byssovorax sp.]
MHARIKPFAFAFSFAFLVAPQLAAAEGSPASPQGKVEEAKSHYRRARELYDENNFRGALVEMQRAYDLSRNAALLFDLGQIQYQLQDYPSALNAFTKYLASNKGDIPPARVAEVQKDIERLKGRIGSLRITSNKRGAQILVDDVVVGTAPLSEPVLVSAGRHKVVATADGQTTTPKVVDVAGAEAIEVSLALAEDAAAPRPSPAGVESPPSAKSGAGATVWVPWAITGGLAVATAVTGALALSKSSGLSSDLGTAGVTRAQIDDSRSATRTMALVSDVLLGTTVAAAGTSLVLTLMSRPANTQAGQVSVRFGIGSVDLQGTF